MNRKREVGRGRQREERKGREGKGRKGRREGEKGPSGRQAAGLEGSEELPRIKKQKCVINFGNKTHAASTKDRSIVWMDGWIHTTCEEKVDRHLLGALVTCGRVG